MDAIPIWRAVKMRFLREIQTRKPPHLPLVCALQVVAEVYAAQDVVVKPHILLSLVLYKIVDLAQVCPPFLMCADFDLLSDMFSERQPAWLQTLNGPD